MEGISIPFVKYTLFGPYLANPMAPASKFQGCSSLSSIKFHIIKILFCLSKAQLSCQSLVVLISKKGMLLADMLLDEYYA